MFSAGSAVVALCPCPNACIDVTVLSQPRVTIEMTQAALSDVLSRGGVSGRIVSKH